MSATANWSYTNTATVQPFTGVDEWGESTFGPEFTIACTWGTNGKQERNAAGSSGAELTDADVIYTEDPRPKRLDRIRLNGYTEFQEIRERVQWDMSFFGETPDYRLTT